MTDAANTTTNTLLPAWIVYAWAPVLWQANSGSHLELVHLGTRVLNIGDDGYPSRGQTLWGAESQDHSAGVAWDWIELPEGAVAMSDPFGLVTNLRIIDATGAELNQTHSVMELHQLVHKLPWQTEVLRLLNKTA